MKKKNKKVIVVGLDGASWNVLEPLIKEGKLPTFERLLQEGSYGPLKSILPPVSLPAWKCYSTGKNPGKLGVYNLLILDFKKRKLSAPTSHDFKSQEIWDYIGEQGYTSCVYNMFATHPAKEIRGCLISDIPNERGFYPKELKEEIDERFGYLYVEPKFTTEREDTYSKVLEGFKRDFDVLMYLLDKYDPGFAHISISHTDGIQHFFWEDMERDDSKYGKNIEKAWIDIDRLLANLLNYLRKRYGDNYYLFIISDHGFEGVKYRFNIGDWLVRKGYLKLNKTGKWLRLSLSLRSQTRVIYSVVDMITNFIRAVLGKREQRWGVQGMLVTASVYERSIDWDRSTVIPLTGECLYINKRAISSSENLIPKLMDEITSIGSPEGNLVVKQIINGKELYRRDSAPDIIILPQNVNIYNAPLAKLSWSKPSRDKWTGKHALYGTLIVYGPDIEEGREITGATLYDIAPTILHILGVPVPEDMDGRVLQEIFKFEEA